ncbi:Ig-like domain-containing protein [Roseisolibacter sp. H3M3-2]|uniref:beta strand repeat-containing protein n=1 Tax=Roseisolibacter sp. H3M3-2 TaxID=3031323 RepID=UPI0023D97A93|nr:Ig-like domain-containing protein [Roseisolibacter sp. H3M3-2]MDF1503102.1 Ig-like domain-containing protein [Roseisolibacter sp. H3M3-2]
MRLVNWRSVAIGVAGFGLAACGDDVSVVQPPSQLTVNPTSVSCQTGGQVAIGASLSPSVTGATFAYQASGTGITVAGNGATATITCATAGAYSVTVTANGQTVTVPVNVTQGTGPATGILIAPTAASVAIGGTVTVNATILGTGTLPAARYRSAQPAIATVDSVSGVVRGVSAGVATIIASPAGVPSLTAAATITVAPAGAFIQSITVTPNPVTLQTGQTQQLAANVQLQQNAPAGTARTVTYTSANNAVATVSATGLVTGVANGTTSIIVRSTADTAFQTVVPVTVRDAAPVRITIANVTNQNTTQLVDITQPIGTNATGNNRTGSIFVTLNLDPGDAIVRRVDVFLTPAASPNDTTNRVCSQIISSAQSEAYRLALSTGSADVQPITCPINLAAFDTTTGIPGIRNGSAVLRARVTGVFPGSTASASQIAQFTQTLTINNLSGFFVRVTNTPDSLQALVNARGTAQGPDGRNWVAGTLRFAILPVQFDSAATGNNASDSVRVDLLPSGTFGPARSASAIAPASGATIITFPGRTATQPSGVSAGTQTTALGNVAARSLTAAASANNIDGYTSGPNGTQVVISGVGFNVTNSAGVLSAFLNGTQQTVTSGTNQTPASFVLNIDNQAPQPATSFVTQANSFTAIPGSFVGFIGGAFAVNDPTASLATRNFAPQFNNTLAGPNFSGTNQTANGDFGGVDRVTTTFFAQLNANLSSLTAANVFNGGTQFSNGGQLAAANQNTAYSAIARYVDVLGNARNQLVQQGAIGVDATTGQIATAGTPLTFGVDLSAPTLTVSNASTINGVVVNAANAGSVPFQINLAYSDDIGFGSQPIEIRGTRQARGSGNGTPTASVSTYCFTEVIGGGAVFTTDNTTVTGACDFIPVAGLSTLSLTTGLTGQYEFTIRTRDQAGNLSTTATVTRYVDITPPTVQGISLPQTLTGNAPAQFTTGATDNLELGQAYAQIGYGAAPAGFGAGTFQIAYTQSLTQLGSPFGTITASVNNSIAINVPSFIRSVTFTDAGTSAPTVPGQGNLASSILAVVTDAALAPAAPANQGTATLAIPAGNVSQTGFNGQIFDTGNQTSDVNGFGLVFFNNAAAYPNQISLGNTANAPTSGTFQVNLQGQANAFINPFVRVELYYAQVGGPAVYQFLGTAPIGFVTDVPANGGTGRTIQSNFVFTPLGSLLARGVTSSTSIQYNVIAVGITANGDALVAQPVQVTIIQ